MAHAKPSCLQNKQESQACAWRHMRTVNHTHLDQVLMNRMCAQRQAGVVDEDVHLQCMHACIVRQHHLAEVCLTP
eukprot:351557-Chlamydomonas_euryale.AAC.1